MRLQLQNPFWVVIQCSLTSFRFRKYIVLFCGDDMLMTHVGYTGFAACIHAVILPFPDLVAYHFVRGLRVSHCLFYTLLLLSIRRFNSPLHFYLSSATIP